MLQFSEDGREEEFDGLWDTKHSLWKNTKNIKKSAETLTSTTNCEWSIIQLRRIHPVPYSNYKPTNLLK
jgi:hypothetical protein